MDEQKTVWVNLDPNKVDLTPIITRCNQAGWRCITEDVGVDQKKSVTHALEADAIVSIGERWGDAQLAAIAGGNRIIIRYGAGLDNVDIPAATRHRIPRCPLWTLCGLRLAERITASSLMGRMNNL